MNTTLGQTIYLRRCERDLTLAQVAEQMGTSAVYLSDIERGKRTPLTDIIMEIASALDLSAFDLYQMAFQESFEHRLPDWLEVTVRRKEQ